MSKHNKREIPIFEHPIIETHCHLDYLKENPLAVTLANARAAGIEKVITIAVSPDNLDTVMTLIKEDDMLWGTQGVHPHDAEKYTQETGDKIRKQALHARIVAIGEIGLDYFYDNADREIQRQVFHDQLHL